MNIVLISPHFPPNFRNFSFRLRDNGANVLGIADVHYDQIPDEVKCALTEYYRVENMHDYDQIVRALGYYTHRYGKIDRIDSHNEYWLETEARLRTDFNIEGVKVDVIDNMKRKSLMKQVFIDAGLKPARGRVCLDEAETFAFIKEVGYPVVAKPDSGVGAAKTYKLENPDQVRHYLADKLHVDYILEEFIQEPIVTFDGLVDASGELVFSSSLRYSKGVMETVNENSDIYYYFSRTIEPRLEAAGKSILKAFDLKARFFHFEFFMKDNGEVIPLEVNMRPPGGFTLDMFNFANNFDCYKAWADVIMYGHTEISGQRDFHVIYVSRKDWIPYQLSHEEVVVSFPELMVYNDRIEDVFSAAIGNHGYVLRSPDLDPLIAAAERIHARA